MQEYTGFAKVYDLFMDNVPYDEWAAYLIGLLKENGVPEGIVAELGCGTGSITRRLKAAGYDMIGIDLSPEMLQIAREKEPEEDDSILYLAQDMREFELYGSVAAIVSICDSMNYLTEDGDLETVMALVNNYLDPGGVFVFDLNTEYYYKRVLGESTICENRPEGSFIWENYYDEESRINEFDLTIYHRSPEGDTVYNRYEETHYQRAYSISEVKKAIRSAGMELVNIFGTGTHEKPSASETRLYVIARKKA